VRASPKERLGRHRNLHGRFLERVPLGGRVGMVRACSGVCGARAQRVAAGVPCPQFGREVSAHHGECPAMVAAGGAPPA